MPLRPTPHFLGGAAVDASSRPEHICSPAHRAGGATLINKEGRGFLPLTDSYLGIGTSTTSVFCAAEIFHLPSRRTSTYVITPWRTSGTFQPGTAATPVISQ